MQVHHIVQIRQRGRVGCAGARRARVVHQAHDVVGGSDFAGDFLGACFVSQVGLIRDQPGRRILGQAVVDVDHLVARLQQHADDGGANPGAAAGDEIRSRFAHISSCLFDEYAGNQCVA
ncbi:hypothetical protein G6F65_022478 [Rhizopus arrhizus]|nr:hypothetical protein G6F65_022478 [Rhizopus arrhizus]